MSSEPTTFPDPAVTKLPVARCAKSTLAMPVMASG